MPRFAPCLLACLLVAGTVPAKAQPVAEPGAQVQARPRIGLALSGGGARGAAHIGVLKVLDELRVPVHCIAGTSMGAVVGGAYAAGTSPAAMQQLIVETDWDDVFSDHPPRGELSIRRKGDDYRGLAAPELGVREGRVLFPLGVVAGVTIEGFLRRLAAPATGVTEFSRLPIPYRAVAADIVSGEEVVLAGGSLAQAMRASMAIPGAVAPVELGGRLLVDGGIANNLPIDVVRGTCADVIVAVNISTAPLKREEITSALSMVGQLVNLLGKQRVDQQLASLGPRDVLVAPALGDITAGSFDRQLEAIAIGERAARAVAASLARYSLPEAEYAALRTAQQAAPVPLGRVDAIRFEGLVRTNQETLAGLLSVRPGEDLDEPHLRADLRRIYGRGDFEAIDYRIDHVAGSRTLVIPVREKAIGPDYLRFGVGLAADFRGDQSFQLMGSLRRTWLNRLGAEWVADAYAGRVSGLATDFYQPLVRSGALFAAPYAQLARTTQDIFVGDDRVANYEVATRTVGADVGVNIGTWGEVRLGAFRNRIDAKVSTGDPVLPRLETSVSGARLRLFADRQDAPWFPRTGYRLVSTLVQAEDGTNSVPRYRRLDGEWSGAASLGPHTFGWTLEAGSGLGTRLPVYDGFRLGGPFRLSGYRFEQFTGERFALASLRYYHRQVRLPSLIGSGVYVGASLEAGRMERMFTQAAGTGTLWSGSVFLAAETFLGPGFLGVGFGRGRAVVYLLLGLP